MQQNINCTPVVPLVYYALDGNEETSRQIARDGVRVSSGHLCEAEAPTEPAGETSNLRGPYGPTRSTGIRKHLDFISQAHEIKIGRPVSM